MPGTERDIAFSQLAVKGLKGSVEVSKGFCWVSIFDQALKKEDLQ
jgi:hypothetical protein